MRLVSVMPYGQYVETDASDINPKDSQESFNIEITEDPSDFVMKEGDRSNAAPKKKTMQDMSTVFRDKSSRALTVNLNSRVSKKYERNEGSLVKQGPQLVYAYILGAIVLGRKNPILVEEDTSGIPKVTSEISLYQPVPPQDENYLDNSFKDKSKSLSLQIQNQVPRVSARIAKWGVGTIIEEENEEEQTNSHKQSTLIDLSVKSTNHRKST